MNNTIIGYNSGLDLTPEDSDYFILGDNISIADVKTKNTKDCIYFENNPKICIAKDMLSEKTLEIIRNK